MKINIYLTLVFTLILSTYGCQTTNNSEANLDITKNLDYCVQQANKTIATIQSDKPIVRNIAPGEKDWKTISYKDWTSGFWPGILWYLYEYTGDEKWQTLADKTSRTLFPLATRSATDHDLGFQVYCSIGNGYRLTNSPEYKDIILKTADTLATLYNPTVGTILSWPAMIEKMNWPHNTIVDNMINLEMLFWASRNGGSKDLYEIAVKHATTTMENHFRDDYTTYHVIVYDTITGEKIKGVTHQGYADESLWARGQAWAIYGYTMTYRETGDAKFLDFAQKVTDVYLERLPEDRIPHWDFDAPNIPNEPKDASAAAIVTSALLELSGYVKDEKKSTYYRTQAEFMIQELSTDNYHSNDKNPAFLLHSTGHFPRESEIDYSIIYADYYYLEALLRLKKLQEGNLIIDPSLEEQLSLLN
ncbi:glycoside hydrolase family 88 protein [Portibacter lacus]|uniref:Glucuronyl hydrolase n=1 Tax=Portibacter lacus TaxID=1099794 RepID=A0AA37STX0_9BACT|nr:glycoside hydrolase family 88 protein [Portibacter lacus]GLR20197.1 glucuronyl hydrolase [Portibacter lacus]